MDQPFQRSQAPAATQAPQVLIAAGCPHGTVTRYRCLHLQEQLAANSIQATVEEWYEPDQIDSRRPLPGQLLALQRVAFTPALGELIDRMHAAGRPVIFDVDDLVFEPQLAAWHRGAATLPPNEQELYAEGVRRYLATLERCDHVLTASPLLAELAARHGIAAHVHRNALGEEMLAWANNLYEVRRRPQGRGEAGFTIAEDNGDRNGSARLVLGYGSGTPTHDVDFAEAAAAVIDILIRYPYAELWVAGPMRLPAELSGFGERVRRFPLLAWRDWFALAAQIDINLAPLEMGNLFCRAKSEIKFVEAAALGIPTVASRIDPFTAAITHGENGLLAANPAEWMEQLARLAADAELRRRMGEAARRSMLERYSPQTRAADLGKLLPELTKTSAETSMNTSERPRAKKQTRTRIANTATASRAETASETAAGEPFVPLTVRWLVSEPIAGSGGHAGILRMVRHLVDFGHVCHVHMIPVNFMHGYNPAQIRRHVDEHFMPTGAVYHQWNGEIGPADATVATFWRTVPPLLKLPMPGRRYYLVQDYEPYFYPMGTEYMQAESSYRQGLHCLTLGPWLARLMREQFGAQADHFDFAVDSQIYYPAATSRPAHPRVAFYARPSTPRRAYELGLEALQIVKQRSPAVEIIFFGAEVVPPPPFAVTNAGLLNPWELAKLFASCDVGVVFSTTNPSFVPFEMMACRCAVVELASERVAGLLEDGSNCRLAEPTPESVAAAVLDLVWNPERRAAIIETAYRQVSEKSWQHSARQIEAVLLAHTPAEQRVAYRAAGSDDIDMLAWQIHQLLDAGGDNAALVDALRNTLYRTLAEKAALVQHVQQVEQRLAVSQQATAGAPARAALQPWADRLLDSAPAWLLGSARMSKLTLDQELLCQSFCADRSHLRRIELRLAARAAVHTGSIHVLLYEGDEQGRLLASELLRVAEVSLEQPTAVEFAPQPDSYGKTYTLCVAVGELNRRPPAIWHFHQVQHAQAQLRRGTQRGGQTLPGQLAFQPFYGEHAPLLPPRQGPAKWNEPIRLAPAVAREVAERQSREVRRLAGQARSALQQRGVAGLAREALNYVEWRLSQRG
jgi:O-antigen biosynthesis protein